MLPKIALISEPTDLTPGKLLPYSIMGLAGVILLYSFTSSSKKDDEEVHDEELEEEDENEQEVK